MENDLIWKCRNRISIIESSILYADKFINRQDKLSISYLFCCLIPHLCNQKVIYISHFYLRTHKQIIKTHKNAECKYGFGSMLTNWIQFILKKKKSQNSQKLSNILLIFPCQGKGGCYDSFSQQELTGIMLAMTPFKKKKLMLFFLFFLAHIGKDEPSIFNWNAVQKHILLITHCLVRKK